MKRNKTGGSFIKKQLYILTLYIIIYNYIFDSIRFKSGKNRELKSEKCTSEQVFFN